MLTHFWVLGLVPAPLHQLIFLKPLNKAKSKKSEWSNGGYGKCIFQQDKKWLWLFHIKASVVSSSRWSYILRGFSYICHFTKVFAYIWWFVCPWLISDHPEPTCLVFFVHIIDCVLRSFTLCYWLLTFHFSSQAGQQVFNNALIAKYISGKPYLVCQATLKQTFVVAQTDID